MPSSCSFCVMISSLSIFSTYLSNCVLLTLWLLELNVSVSIQYKEVTQNAHVLFESKLRSGQHVHFIHSRSSSKVFYFSPETGPQESRNLCMSSVLFAHFCITYMCLCYKLIVEFPLIIYSMVLDTVDLFHAVTI